MALHQTAALKVDIDPNKNASRILVLDVNHFIHTLTSFRK